MLLRIAAWRPCWEVPSLICSFFVLGAEEAICCWLVLADPYSTSSSGSGALEWAACLWSWVLPSKGLLCSATLLVAWEAVETFPSSFLMAWRPEQAHSHHGSEAGSSLLTAEGRKKGCNSSPFSYTKHLGGSDFSIFLPKLLELWPSRYSLDNLCFLIKHSLVDGS